MVSVLGIFLSISKLKRKEISSSLRSRTPLTQLRKQHSRAACKADRQCVQSTKHHHYPSGLQFLGDIPDKLILDMLMEAGIGSLGCEGRVVTRAPCEGCC